MTRSHVGRQQARGGCRMPGCRRLFRIAWRSLLRRSASARALRRGLRACDVFGMLVAVFRLRAYGFGIPVGCRRRVRVVLRIAAGSLINGKLYVRRPLPARQLCDGRFARAPDEVERERADADDEYQRGEGGFDEGRLSLPLRAEERGESSRQATPEERRGPEPFGLAVRDVQ